ncbi:unnamed protein product [Owenia fusiformis]|uniref:Methyltransferase FkbM domain-containing protein n=1 Tax=Owenia fusiformis TaxID=6347 RepID=A0A8J1YCX0_OWEFU|nr:unnamed protein product [Owenia fusiformis]
MGLQANSQARNFALVILSIGLLATVFYGFHRQDRMCLIDPGNRDDPRDVRIVPNETPSLNIGKGKALSQEEIDGLFKETTAQDDPVLIRYIAQSRIDLPSYQPYDLDGPSHRDFSRGQSGLAEKLLPDVERGFFVECGALDGEGRSNSLYFERERHWEGLLIEADPLNYKDVVRRKRKAYASNSCLSPFPYPSKLKYKQSKNTGKAMHSEEEVKKYSNKDVLQVDCFTLYSFMLALNRTVIDFFSLDVEGSELPILKTIPFDKLTIKALTVEFVHGQGDPKADIVDYLKQFNYVHKGTVTRGDWTANDVVFVRKDFDKGLEFKTIRNYSPP